MDKINPEIMKGIESRAKILSRKFWHLEYEDLVQDGIVLVLTLLKNKPEANLLWIMKAINNYYSTVMRIAIKYHKSRKELTPAIEETYIDPNSIIEKIECPDLDSTDDALVVTLVKEYEITLEELETLIGDSAATLYRKVTGLKE